MMILNLRDLIIINLQRLAMTILSKLVNQRLGSSLRRSSPGGAAWSRMFRWDAKPDNIQAHSFRHGLYAGGHWTWWALSVIGLSFIVNWTELKQKYGISLPIPFIRETLEFFTK